MAYKIVSEELVRQAADMAGQESSFTTALQYGKDFREAGMIPVYYTDDEDMTLFVTTEEKMAGITFH